VLGLLAFCLGAWWGDHTIVPFLIAKLNPNNPSVQAQTLFEEAWQRAKTDFRDPSMNHQQWDTWRQRYDGKLSEPADAYVAIDSMLASLNDEYSRFLPPNEMREQSMQINAELFGVGIQMGMRNGQLTVVTSSINRPPKQRVFFPKR
jgi:carboxyl-terminal processing protease